MVSPPFCFFLQHSSIVSSQGCDFEDVLPDPITRIVLATATATSISRNKFFLMVLVSDFDEVKIRNVTANLRVVWAPGKHQLTKSSFWVVDCGF